ncbi:MAG: hypothetical protein ACHQFW_00305 [Chitinophagales bacterium]
MAKSFNIIRCCIAFFTIITLVLTGCSDLPGDGGTSTITGKVYVLRFNEFGTQYQDYYGPDESVFIIYGDGTAVDDEVKTSYDGTYEFRFLRKGSYTIYCYSDCLTCDGSTEPIFLNAEITDNHQELLVDDITIEKR